MPIPKNPPRSRRMANSLSMIKRRAPARRGQPVCGEHPARREHPVGREQAERSSGKVALTRIIHELVGWV